MCAPWAPVMRTTDTPLDHLARSLRARASTPSGQATPAAILWTDPKAEWRALLPAALTHIPELLALGEYRPEHRTGPAIWLRCVVDRALDSDLPPEPPPSSTSPAWNAASCEPAKTAPTNSSRSSS